MSRKTLQLGCFCLGRNQVSEPLKWGKLHEYMLEAVQQVVFSNLTRSMNLV